MCRCDCCTVYSVVADIRGTRTRRKSWLTFFFCCCCTCALYAVARTFLEKEEKRESNAGCIGSAELQCSPAQRLAVDCIHVGLSFSFFFVHWHCCSYDVIACAPLRSLSFDLPPLLLLSFFRMTIYPQYGRYRIRGKKEKKTHSNVAFFLFYSLPVRPVVRKDANIPHAWVAAGDWCDLFRLHPRLRLHPILDADVVSRAEHLATHLRRRRTGPTRVCTLYGSRGRVQQPGRDAAHLRQGSSA